MSVPRAPQGYWSEVRGILQQLHAPQEAGGAVQKRARLVQLGRSEGELGLAELVEWAGECVPGTLKWIGSLTAQYSGILEIRTFVVPSGQEPTLRDLASAPSVAYRRMRYGSPSFGVGSFLVAPPVYLDTGHSMEPIDPIPPDVDTPPPDLTVPGLSDYDVLSGALKRLAGFNAPGQTPGVRPE